MKTREHQSITTKRDDDVSVIRRHFAIARAQMTGGF
jgi:hypothetical protein